MHEPVRLSRQEAGHPVTAAAAVLRQSTRVFPGHERELSRLRSWLSSLLPDCPERDEVLSVATELGSNALEHTASGDPSGSFAVEVAWHQTLVQRGRDPQPSQDPPHLLTQHKQLGILRCRRPRQQRHPPG
jgi:hypothetical protein